MFCPTRILVPIDFGRSAMPAARCAHDVARIFGSRVYLLHVAPEQQDEACRADAMSELASFAALATQPGAQRLGRLGPTLAVRVSDDAPAAILAYAREAGCDLVVMGTHHADPLEPVRDSTADWVRRHAVCPVVMVPPVTATRATPRATSGRVEATMAAAS
jgi:nucleotide-binding universal stress UspA family protein